jgi:hypothetical protein
VPRTQQTVSIQKGNYRDPISAIYSSYSFWHRSNSLINLCQGDFVPFLLNSPLQFRRIEDWAPILKPLLYCPPNRLNWVEIRRFRRVGFPFDAQSLFGLFAFVICVAPGAMAVVVVLQKYPIRIPIRGDNILQNLYVIDLCKPSSYSWAFVEV